MQDTIILSLDSCLLAAFIGRCSPSSGMLNSPRLLLPVSSSNSSKQLNPNSSVIQQPIYQQTATTGSAYNIQARTGQKTPLPLLLHAFVALEACVFAVALPNNDCCIVAYFAVVAQQRTYVSENDVSLKQTAKSLFLSCARHWPLSDVGPEFLPRMTFQQQTNRLNFETGNDSEIQTQFIPKIYVT